MQLLNRNHCLPTTLLLLSKYVLNDKSPSGSGSAATAPSIPAVGSAELESTSICLWQGAGTPSSAADGHLERCSESLRASWLHDQKAGLPEGENPV